MLALGYDHYVAQGSSTHTLLAVVFLQSNWQVPDWPFRLVAYIQSPIRTQVYSACKVV